MKTRVMMVSQNALRSFNAHADGKLERRCR